MSDIQTKIRFRKDETNFFVVATLQGALILPVGSPIKVSDTMCTVIGASTVLDEGIATVYLDIWKNS